MCGNLASEEWHRRRPTKCPRSKTWNRAVAWKWRSCWVIRCRTRAELDVPLPTVDTCYRLLASVNRHLQPKAPEHVQAEARRQSQPVPLGSSAQAGTRDRA